MKRYAFLFLVFAQAGSCSGVTHPSGASEYLRCPSSMSMGTSPDTGLSGADSSLFGGQTMSSPYNCINDSTLCATLGANFVCDTNQGCCQEAPPVGFCSKSSDCMQNDKPVCNLTANICIACSTGNTQMQAQGNQQCQDWVTAHSDPLQRNLCVNGLCAECMSNTDCKRPGKTICDPTTNICGGCVKNSDCPTSNICKRDPSLLATGDDLTKIGDCADPSLVAYVNLGYQNCGTGDGSQAKPVCRITDALALPTVPSYINVIGAGSNSVAFYTPVTVATSGQRLTLIGPGRDVAYSTAQAVLESVTVSNGAQLTLIGLGVTNRHGSPAIQCDTSSSLYVNNVIISDDMMPTAPKGGIYANNCTIVSVEKTKIAHVAGYGISILGGSGHRVVNNAIIDGGAGAQTAGLRIGNGATGLFSFNTIASNLGGVQCDSVATVTDSIVYSNGMSGSMQVTGSCMSARIVTQGIALNPSYTLASSPGDPTLEPNGDMAGQLIDQGQPDANKTIKDDYFGAARPAGNGYDIGFQEVR
jgi:hypothetical protein